MLCCQVQEEDILLVKGPTGAPERKPFDTRRESTEREWFVVRVAPQQRLFHGFHRGGFCQARMGAGKAVIFLLTDLAGQPSTFACAGG